MSTLPKIIIEVNGGVVQAVYADLPYADLPIECVECVIVDHDEAKVLEQHVDELREFDGADVKTYDRRGNTSWVW